MKVKELRLKLERYLNKLEDYDDDDQIKIVSNTYFLGDNCRYFLGVSGYDGGYIDLDNPVEEDEEDFWEEDEDEDN